MNHRRNKGAKQSDPPEVNTRQDPPDLCDFEENNRLHSGRNNVYLVSWGLRANTRKCHIILACAIISTTLFGFLQSFKELEVQDGKTDKDLLTIRNNSDYLRCKSHGRLVISSSMPLIWEGRESRSLDLLERLPHDLLVEADTCAAAFHALDSSRFQYKEQKLQQQGLFHNDSLLRKDLANIFTTLGIIEYRKNNLLQSRMFFTKAFEMSSNSSEANWYLTQLPPPTLSKQLGRVEEDNSASPTEPNGQSVLCCIVKDEEAYIEEWADYNLGIGFSKIVVYDNSDGYNLKQWGIRRGSSTIDVIHFPGSGKQFEAYLDCAKRTLNGVYGNKTWAGFFDVDEFLVMKKHNTVDDFLKEHLPHGALSINWAIFGQSGKTVYEPIPVTKRFVYREKDLNKHVKSFVRLSDMNIDRAPINAHFPILKTGPKYGNQHDTNGNIINGPFNYNLPFDTAVLHHYVTKSYQEEVRKRFRGRVSLKNWNPLNQSSGFKDRHAVAVAMFEEALANSTIGGKVGETFDDSAWTILKKVAPRWALYDFL